MSELPKIYDPSAVEEKLYKFWNDSGFFHAEVDEKETFTIVIPPPNVTGQLHMGYAFDETLAGYPDPHQAYAGLFGVVDARHGPCGYRHPD